MTPFPRPSLPIPRAILRYSRTINILSPGQASCAIYLSVSMFLCAVVFVRVCVRGSVVCVCVFVCVMRVPACAHVLELQGAVSYKAQ